MSIEPMIKDDFERDLFKRLELSHDDLNVIRNNEDLKNAILAMGDCTFKLYNLLEDKFKIDSKFVRMYRFKQMEIDGIFMDVLYLTKITAEILP